jgi:uncharacterized membrane protein SpoIIM required for sporulation
MTVNDFIKLREKDWSRLQNLVNRNKGRGRMTASEVREIGTLYRAVISDLAQARRDYPGQKVSIYLNQLLTRTHSFIYQEDTNDFGGLWRYFAQTIPQAFRRNAIFTLVAFLLFIIPAATAFQLARTDPNVAETLGLQQVREDLANDDLWTNIPIEDRPWASSYIMTNNIRVALFAFGGGVLFGLFSIYVLMFNGVHIGAVLGLAVHYGQGQALLDFIFAHGVIELSIIFIAGGAGLQLGWAVVNPGLYTRRTALAEAASQVLPLAVLAFPVLISAGLIEGFLSPSGEPFSTKVLVGVVTGLMLYSYGLSPGRPKAAAEPQKGFDL